MHPLDRPFITRDPTAEHMASFIRRMTRWLIIMNIMLAVFTVFNLYIYPEHIYEPPEPVLHSPHVATLHPYEI